MNTPRIDRALSRRSALAGLGAGGLGLALAAGGRSAAAQEAATEMANHPIVGAWNATTPGGPAPGIFFPNGIALMTPQATQAGPNGVTFVTGQIGVWEPVDARGAHFTGVQIHSDAEGTYVGSVTIDGYPVVSEDGRSLLDDQSRGTITIRDATGAILQEIATAGAPPVTGTRMGVGAPGFPAAAPETATPAP
jgi:hypothetical protein